MLLMKHNNAHFVLKVHNNIEKKAEQNHIGDNNDDIHQPLQQAPSTPCPTCPRGVTSMAKDAGMLLSKIQLV